MASCRNNSNIFSKVAGDKVLWIIALMLCMISAVCISSATSRQVTEEISRLDILKDQLFTIGAGFAIMLAAYKLGYGFFRRFARLILWFALFLLTILTLHVKSGPIHAQNINSAWRTLSFMGFQIHVFEVAKIAMVIYIAWAVEALENDDFPLVNRLATSFRKLAFLMEKGWKEAIFICAPIIAVCLLVLAGSNSSAIFIGGLMVMTLLISGAPLRDILWICGIAVTGFSLLLAISVLAPKDPENGKKGFGRMSTFVSRMAGQDDPERTLREAKPHSIEWDNARDLLIQKEGAKEAIRSGGIIGKGPGQSTQKYFVPVMSEDYMFSFIVEEYGLVGALIIMILYLGIVTRCKIIAKNCKTVFQYTAVVGCCLLISGQAFFHIVVNADLGLTTGQTLPMISNGTSAFLCFSLAFGLMLAISRETSSRVDKEVEKFNPQEIWNTDQSEQ